MFGHTRLLYLHFGANQVPSADSGRFCREKLRRGGDFSAVQALWMGLTIDGAHSIISPVHALVAQLDRASDSDSEGRTFESCRAHHEKSLDFTQEIEAFFLCVDNRFSALGDCFGDYTPTNPRFPGAPPPTYCSTLASHCSASGSFSSSHTRSRASTCGTSSPRLSLYTSGRRNLSS